MAALGMVIQMVMVIRMAIQMAMAMAMVMVMVMEAMAMGMGMAIVQRAKGVGPKMTDIWHGQAWRPQDDVPPA